MPCPRFLMTLAIVAALTSTSTLFAQSILYVDDSATGANNGSTWCNAFVYLQDALAAARTSGGAVTEIRVAQGTYKPDRGVNQTPGNRPASFELVSGVALRGGYAGCGAPDPNARDIPVYETILSGDLSDNDATNESNCCLAHFRSSCDDQTCSQQVCAVSSSCCTSLWTPTCAFYARNLCSSICSALTENSYHVVTADDLSSESQLDGLTLSLGNANGPQSSGDDVGGGIRCRHSEVAVRDCSIVSNMSEMLGGGLFLSDGMVTIANSSFIRNQSTNGGGLYFTADSTVLSSSFVTNVANTDGGAVYATGSPILRDCVFQGGYAGRFGGAVSYTGGSGVKLMDSVFVANHGDNGGAIWLSSGDLRISGSKFAGNTAGSFGGAILCGADLQVVDSILAANASIYGAGVHNYSGNMQFANCAVVSNMGGGFRWNAGVPKVRNTILYSNLGSGGATGELVQLDGSMVNIAYSCVSGWTGALGGVGNHGNNPLMIGGPLGAWTVDASYDRNNGKATLVDNTASWQPNEWVGKFLNPDTSQYLQSLIVSNSNTTITVLGDFASLGVAGATYKINNYHLSAGSPCIDAGDNSATDPCQPDLDGNLRRHDDQATVDTGNGIAPIVDMGAYEFDSDQAPDCNANGLLDSCDIEEVFSSDCNANGVPDECDISNCPPEDTACQDCDADGVMNGCEPVGEYCESNADCDDGHFCTGDWCNPENCTCSHSVADPCCEPTGACPCSIGCENWGYCCDLATDTCVPAGSLSPLTDPTGISKCRFLSLQSTSSYACESAIRVKLVSLHHVEPPYTGAPSVPFTSFEGQVRWVGSPVTYVPTADGLPLQAAALQCTPHYQNWSTVGLVHVTGSAIVPSSVYEVQSVAASCMGIEASCTVVSAPLEIRTTRWGDVEVPYNPPGPTDQPDVGDIAALVKKFGDLPGAPSKERALLIGNDEFGNINIAPDLGFGHIAACVDAFRGKPYPHTIAVCP